MTSPEYYNPDSIETIDVIEAWNLGFNLGNALKYMARAGSKKGEARAKDLGKAIVYIHREIHGRWPWKEAEAPAKNGGEEE